jgi:hypothetical protein
MKKKGSKTATKGGPQSLHHDVHNDDGDEDGGGGGGNDPLPPPPHVDGCVDDMHEHLHHDLPSSYPYPYHHAFAMN